MSNGIARHTFVSNCSGVDRSGTAVTVGFSRDPADESSLDGLLIQRGKGDLDEAGIDGVYVEIPIQRHVVYGGIIEAALQRESFTLRLNGEAAREMRGFQEIHVSFELPSQQFADIQDGLRFVFQGCPCYREYLD